MKTLLLIVVSILLFINSKAQFMDPFAINEENELYTSSFIAEWGSDTASIETFSIIGNHLFGRAIHLYPEPHLRHFSYYFNEDGSIRNMDVQFYSVDNTSIPLKSKAGLPIRITLRSENEVVDFRVIDSSGEKQFIHNVNRMDFFGGWVPIISQLEWLSQLSVNHKISDYLKFINYVIGDYNMKIDHVSEYHIVFESDISAPIQIYLDQNNRIKEIDALGSPWNYTITKQDPINLEDYTTSFAKKKILGDPSPHEKFITEIGECNISIDYGRPSKRGRKIFGNVVPWNEIWRTGAGTPTILETSCDLQIRGKRIPKGIYNLFTIPNQDKWALIFNTEKEAWGSAYKKEYDLEQIEMESSQLKYIEDKFIIEIIQKDSQTAELQLKWEDRMARVILEFSK